MRYSVAELLRARVFAMAIGASAQDDLDRLAHAPTFWAAVWDRRGTTGMFFRRVLLRRPNVHAVGGVFGSVDSLPRQPIQIYEFVFHIAMAFLLYLMLVNDGLKGQPIKLCFISYFLFRFITELIWPEIHWTLGLTTYQSAIVILLPMFCVLWVREHRNLNVT